MSQNISFLDGARPFSLKTSHTMHGGAISYGSVLLQGAFRRNGQSEHIEARAAQSETLWIGSIEEECGEVVPFKCPLPFEILHTDLGWKGINKQIHITEFGNSKEECYANLESALSFAWEEFALEQDEKLSPEAMRIASYLRSLVRP